MMQRTDEMATFGGGCFWCLEAVFDQIDGVEEVTSGYAGGTIDNPGYDEVCSGTTGHAEVVQVRFDPRVVGYRDLLDIFFTIHDPTTLNRQGADVGTQYRSVIFYHDPAQRETAERTIRELGERGIWKSPIVTELTPAPVFYPAEAYHQEYYSRNASQPYCQVVIEPKLAKLRRAHFDRLTSSRESRGAGQVRPFQAEPQNPLDHGGIAD